MHDVFVDKLPAIYHALQAALTNDVSRPQYRYLLLDRLASVSELSLIYSAALQDTLAPALLAVIKRPELTHHLASCPLLVCLAEPNEALNTELMLAALAQIKNDYLTSKQYVCGFLASPLMPERLAAALLVSCLSAGNALSRSYLPFYEPFTLDILWHSYEEPTSHLGLLLPNDTRYCFVDLDGECHTFTSIAYQDEYDLVQGLVNPTLRYHLLNQAELYHLVVTWQELGERQNNPLPKHALSKVIHVFYDATAVQLSSASDRRAYVLFSLQYGELMHSAKLAAVINGIIGNEQPPGQLGRLLSQQGAALSALRPSD